jgi:hypothetical protein
MYQNGFLAHGTDPLTAHQWALAVIQGLIYQQAAVVVAYAYVFALLGVLFVACLPLLALIRRARSQPESHAVEIRKRSITRQTLEFWPTRVGRPTLVL